MECYFDGSVGGKSDEWLTLGGLAASDATWAIIQKQWDLMLKNRDPVAPYIHMTDLIGGKRPFKGDSGWTKPKVQGLVSDIVSLLCSIRGGDLCAFACAVDVKACQRLHAEGYDVSSPAVICAELGLGNLLTWWNQKHGLEKAHLFYDQNEQFIQSIRGRWLQATRGKRTGASLLWDSIANIQPVPMKDTPGIQAADVIAWSFTRRLRYPPEHQWANLATILIGSRELKGRIDSFQLDPITEEIMRPRYPKRHTTNTNPTQPY